MVAALLLLQLLAGVVGDLQMNATRVKALQNFVAKQKMKGVDDAQLVQYYDCGMCQGVLAHMCSATDTCNACDPTNPFWNMIFGQQRAPVVVNIQGPLVDCGGCSCCNNIDCVGDGESVSSSSSGLSPQSTCSSVSPKTVRCGSCQSVPNDNNSLQACINGSCPGTFAHLDPRTVSDPDCPPPYTDCGECQCVPQEFCNTPYCPETTKVIKSSFPKAATVVQAARGMGYWDCGVCMGVPDKFCDDNVKGNLAFWCNPEYWSSNGNNFAYGYRSSQVDGCEEGLVDCGACLCVPLQYCAGTNAIGVCGGSFIGSGLAAVQVGSCTVQPNTELADSHYPGLGVWFMLSGAYFFFALFVSLLPLKDFFVIDLFGLSVYQNGDCEPETQLQEETGCRPARLVSPSSRHCTPWTFEVEEHHTHPWKSSFQRLELPLSCCGSNDNDESCSMEMPHLSAIEEEQCNVLFCMPAAMAKRDRPVLCAWLEAASTDGPRPVSAVTMAAASTARLASTLAVDIFERKNTFSEAKTTAKECQGQQDPQTGSTEADAGSAYDDAGCSYGAGSTDAHHVPSTGNAVPYICKGQCLHCPRQREHGNRLRIPIWRKCLLQFLLHYIRWLCLLPPRCQLCQHRLCQSCRRHR